MKHTLRNKMDGSVFFHILAAILVTGLAVILASGIFLRLFAHRPENNPIKKNIKAYANYIIQDLGMPPDPKRAEQLAADLYIDIRFEGADTSWTTAKGLPTMGEMQQLLKARKKWHHKPYIVIEKPYGKFLFHANFKSAVDPMPPATLLLFFCFLGVLFFLAWMWIRWILRPLVLLNEGVQAISDGHLDHTISIRRHDELGRLAKSFNHMTSRIREMIRNKDQVLMDISHEFRSPLTRMKVALELMPDSKHKAGVQEDVDDLERMIYKILEAGKAENAYLVPHKQILSMAQLAKKVVDNYQGQSPQVIFHDTGELGGVLADQEQMRTVLENIIENALKYSQPGSEPIQVELRQEGQTVLVTIQDHGIGIPAEHLPRICEPFYRVDPSRAKTTGGFGLGLSICKRIIEAHEGRLEIISELDKGTSVTIKLAPANDQDGFRKTPPDKT